MDMFPGGLDIGEISVGGERENSGLWASAWEKRPHSCSDIIRDGVEWEEDLINVACFYHFAK